MSKFSRMMVLLVMFGLGAFFAFAMADNADTAFNEMDRPLAVSSATLPLARLIVPGSNARHVSQEFGSFLEALNSAAPSQQASPSVHSNDLHALHCVFLI